MKPVHQVFFLAGLLILGLTTWLVLTRPKPQAAWLSVAAPAEVAPGETITLRVTLTKPDDSLQLTADLHGWTKRNRPLRSISHARPVRMAASARAMDFQLLVPQLPDLGAIRAVIYLSPTGRWQDRIRSVTSEEIPVEGVSGSSSPRPLQSLRAHDQVADPVIPRIESATLRLLLTGLWLVVAFALIQRRRGALLLAPGAARPPSHPPSLLLIGACGVVALAEILHAETRIADWARNLAVQHGYYDERLLPQQIAVLVTVVGLAALAATALFRTRHRPLVIGLLGSAALSLTATLSLHETDALLYTTLLGQPVEQLAKLLAVALAIWGLRPRSDGSAGA